MIRQQTHQPTAESLGIKPLTRREHAESLAVQIVAASSPLEPLASEFLDLLEQERARTMTTKATP